MRIEMSRFSRAAALALACVTGAGALSGCGLLRGNTYPPAPRSAETLDHRYKIGPLDTLNVVVWRNPELSSTVTVRPANAPKKSGGFLGNVFGGNKQNKVR